MLIGSESVAIVICWLISLFNKPAGIELFAVGREREREKERIEIGGLVFAEKKQWRSGGIIYHREFEMGRLLGKWKDACQWREWGPPSSCS